MKIEKWQVENGIAKPVNPYKEHNDKSKFSIVKKAEIGLYVHFVQQYGDIKFATDAPIGIHSAEMFGEVYKEVNTEQGWHKVENGHTEIEYNLCGLEIRQFLPFKHPVEPNDKQRAEIGPKVCGQDCDCLSNEDCHFHKENRIKDGSVTVGSGIVQPLNPNANAIKVINGLILHYEDRKRNTQWDSEKSDFIISIVTLKNLSKLLQS